MTTTSFLWIDQAEHNLEVASYLMKGEYWSWSMFVSHQAAEIAVKGSILLFVSGENLSLKEMYGASRHRVKELLEKMPFQLKGNPIFAQNFSEFDKIFEDARYPWGVASGGPVIPWTMYNEENAKDTYKIAEEVVKYCKKLVETLEKTFESI